MLIKSWVSLLDFTSIYTYICQLLARMFLNKHFTLHLLCFFSSGRERFFQFLWGLWTIDCRWNADVLVACRSSLGTCDPKTSSFGNVFLSMAFHSHTFNRKVQKKQTKCFTPTPNKNTLSHSHKNLWDWYIYVDGWFLMLHAGKSSWWFQPIWKI